MDVSELMIDGALEPTHSTDTLSGADPRAGGLDHISMEHNRIASMIRAAAVGDVATHNKFRRLARVTVTVPPAVLKNLNL
jgi:hypothetical protein